MNLEKNKMVLKTLFLAYLFHILHYAHGYSLVTSRPVEESGPRLMELEDIYNRQDDFRLNDREAGLTALKDKKLVSCFVNDYDPLWLPAPSDKNYIIRNQPCEKVNKTTDFQTLQKKAGKKIANMCKELYVFWLAARNIRPPLLPGVYQQSPLSRCVFDDDFPIPTAIEELDGENTQSGNSGAQPLDFKPLVTHEIAPPMLRPDAPPMYRESAPQTSQNGPPPLIRDGEGAPQMKRNGAPLMSRDGAPPLLHGAHPMSHDGAPPVLHGAHPMSYDGAPPMLSEVESPLSHDGAPPMFGDDIPPMLRGVAPPLSHDGAPPMIDGVPPMFKDGEMKPPLAGNSHFRRDLDASPMSKTASTVQENPPSLNAVLKKMLTKNGESLIVAPPIPDMKTPPPPKEFLRNN